MQISKRNELNGSGLAQRQQASVSISREARRRVCARTSRRRCSRVRNQFERTLRRLESREASVAASSAPVAAREGAIGGGKAFLGSNAQEPALKRRSRFTSVRRSHGTRGVAAGSRPARRDLRTVRIPAARAARSTGLAQPETCGCLVRVDVGERDALDWNCAICGRLGLDLGSTDAAGEQPLKNSAQLGRKCHSAGR